jgi:TonB family protein
MRTLVVIAVSGISVLWSQESIPVRIVGVTSYVALARQARIEGDVEVRCVLDASGAVITSEAISGHPLLKRQAEADAREWRFRRTGTGESTATLVYSYRLAGKATLHDETRFVFEMPNHVNVTSSFAQLNP